MNYHNELIKIIDNLDHIPKLLLHSCCGPCSTYCIDFLTKYFDVTVLYYNPNIEPIEEYEKRKEEQIRFINSYKSNNKLDFLDCEYDNESFKECDKGLEKEKEGGARCHKCYYLRMDYTAKKAKELGYEYFGTTLTVSPYKNSDIINNIGKSIETKCEVKFLLSDFKKKDGYKKSIELSKEYNLYRQEYCGCSYSNISDII